MSFESEHREIYNEFLEKRAEIDKKERESKMPPGLDSIFDPERRKCLREYNKKLIALKEKYGLE